MKPSMKPDNLKKGDVIEYRAGVQITFNGGHWCIISWDGGEKKIQGFAKVADFAEKKRLELNPDYVAPSEDDEETPPEPSAQPEAEAEEAPADDAADEEEQAAADPPAAVDKAEASDEAKTMEKITYAGIECGRMMVSPSELESAVEGDYPGRVSALRGSEEALALRPSLRATDGACAPVIFLTPAAEGERATLFAGLETIAAALDEGMEEVPLLVFDHEHGPEIQSYLSAPKPTNSQKDDDADLIFQVEAAYGLLEAE